MEIGAYFFPTAEGPGITDVARAAEERAFESLFVPEHSHIPATPTAFLDPAGKPLPERYRRIYDPFVALGAAAAVTSRLLLGTAACIVTQRDVVLTAKAVATLDQLSNGRFVFGVGAGWNAEELRTHGVDPAKRIAVLNESVEAMSRIWAEDEPEFHGEHIDFGPIWCWPKPVQRPRPPILVAGDSAGAAKRAARYGDGWLPTHRGGDDLDARIRTLHAFAEQFERNPPTVTYLAHVVDERTIERCLTAGVNRVLALIQSDSLDAATRALDSHRQTRDRVVA